jgi:hypothetical protein
MSEKPPRTRPTDSMPAIVDDADSFDRVKSRKLGLHCDRMLVEDKPDG